MQNFDSEGGLNHFGPLSGAEYRGEKPFISTADEEAASYGQNLQTVIADPTGLDTPAVRLLNGMEISHIQYERCFATLLDVFPGISSEYVRGLYKTWMQASRSRPYLHQVPHAFQDMTLQILDAKSYPKEKDRTNELKRKRSQALDSDEEDMLRWKTDGKGQQSIGYLQAVSWELQAEFINLPAHVINRKIQEEGSCYAAYLALAKDELTFVNGGKSPYPRLKHSRKVSSNPFHRKPDSIIRNEPEVQRELRAARERITKIRAKRKAEADAVEAEAAAEKLQRDRGDVFECQCCYEDFTMNKITHCDGDTIHYFCLDCAKRNADNEIGKLRYKLICMSGDVCAASFSRSERHRFLDKNALKALDRMQLQAEAKDAGLEISWCPFCDFGASCPPVYIDKEFRCQSADCGKVSCRKCKLESHIPFTCEEWKKENQLSERHILEEARTAALLKKCPKCDVPIIKDHGCNRLTCPCGGTMCDFCGKDITKTGYGHFKRDDGNDENDKRCPTFDDCDARRREAVKSAEADALKEARARNPDLNPDALKIKFHDDAPSASEKAGKNARRRDSLAEIALARATAARQAAMMIYPPVPKVRQATQLAGPVGQHIGPGPGPGPVEPYPGSVRQYTGPVGQFTGLVEPYPGSVGHYTGPVGHYPPRPFSYYQGPDAYNTGLGTQDERASQRPVVHPPPLAAAVHHHLPPQQHQTPPQRRPRPPSPVASSSSSSFPSIPPSPLTRTNNFPQSNNDRNESSHQRRYHQQPVENRRFQRYNQFAGN